MANTQPAISWEVKEYEHRQRGVDWFWAIALLAGVGAVVSIVFDNFLLAVIILLGAVSLIMYAKREPENMMVELSPTGVKIGKTLYPYKNLKTFWVTDESERCKLLLESTRSIMPIIDVRAPSARRDEIMEYINDYLPALEREESLIDALGDWFGL